jgi:predicted CXXCH cytochrome family protein
MARRIVALALTLAAAPALAAAAPPPTEAPCTLPRVDRARTGSRACIGCHDGSIGLGAAHALAGGAPGGEHPVDVSYARAFARQPGSYRSAFDLPRAVVLPEGRVACTSCHDAASAEPHRAAVPMGGSALCFTCHVA